MKKVIKNVELTGGVNGNRLNVSIPQGMNGVKLMEWKRNNQLEIEEFTNKYLMNSSSIHKSAA
jgi:hypothetical protein